MQTPRSNSSELQFILKINSLYRHWWVLAVAIIVGGSLGWLIHYFKTPIYEAKSSMIVTMDFAQTGDLSAYNLDQAVGAIQYIFYSREVLQKVVDIANRNEIDIEYLSFSKSIRMERADQTWYLIVQNPNQDRAGHLVSVWAEEGYKDLFDARSHAIRAGMLKSQLVALRNCPMEPSQQAFLPVICFQAYNYKPESETDLINRIQQELVLSKGINQDIIFSQPEITSSSREPVIYRRVWLILSGMIIGLLSGVVVLLNPVIFGLKSTAHQ